MSLPCTLAFRIGTQGPSGPFACSQTEADSQGHEVGTVQMFATVVSGSKCYQCAATFPSCSFPSIMSQCPLRDHPPRASASFSCYILLPTLSVVLHTTQLTTPPCSECERCHPHGWEAPVAPAS